MQSCKDAELQNLRVLRSFFSTPPQAWQVKNRQPEVCHELP